jgi:anti-sigma factor RsiW
VAFGLADHLTPELLSALIDEELDPVEAREVQEHLSTCLHCRYQLDGLRRVSMGLRKLEREALPAALDTSIRRQLALDRTAGGLRSRLAERSELQRRVPAQVGLGFALVLALALIGWLFSAALARRGDGSVVVPISPSMLVDSHRELGGLLFDWQGDTWREAGTTGEPDRILARGSEEWHELLAAHPGVDTLLETSPRVILRWQGQLVALARATSAPPDGAAAAPAANR